MKVKHFTYACVLIDTKLLHRRLGHVNNASFKHMALANLANDLLILCETNNLCDTYLYGKQTKYPFHKHNNTKTSGYIQLDHSNVGGPMKTTSLNRSKFYVIFIDDFNRYCWIYFLKHKSNVFGCLVKFMTLVENEAKKTIKVLRTKNGSKNTLDEFKNFIALKGIKHKFTISYYSQQNRVC